MEEFETRSVGCVSGAEIKALLNILLKLKLFFQISSFILRARINVSNDPTAVREKSSNSTIFQPRGGKMKRDSQSSCWRRRCVFKSCHRSALCVLRQWGRSKSGPILAAVSVGWRLCAWPGMKERAQSDSERITGRDEPPKSGSEVRQRRQDGQRTPGGRSCFYQRLCLWAISWGCFSKTTDTFLDVAWIFCSSQTLTLLGFRKHQVWV